MADQAKKVLSKQKLEVKNIEIDVPYSQGTKSLDRINAVNLSLPEGNPLSGKPLRMTVFNADLKTFIRGKTLFTADIEETEQPNSEYGPNRVIVQAYDEKGEPVSKKKSWGGGGKSTETVQMEITAGFRKAALEQAVEYLKGGTAKLSDITALGDTFYSWLINEVKPSPQAPQSTGKPSEKPASISAQKTADSKSPVKGDDYLEWLKGGISAAGTTNKDVMVWIKENLKIDKPTITDAVLKMTPEQKEKLKKHINDLVVEKEKLF